MNGPGDLTITHNSATPDPKNCSLVSIVGMSSCRGRAEAFARRLSSKLRTLGTQADEANVSQEDEPIINGGNANTWITSGSGGEQTVTDIQPLRHETDSYFDFDCEIESPGSPVDECEYLRLIESTSNTPHNSAAESGYACASAASSNSSSDGPYFDVTSETEVCTSHIQHAMQPQHQQHTSSLLCQTQQQMAKDEVDSTCISTSAERSKCNGYKNQNDLTQILPCEGPDIQVQENYNVDHQLENSKQIDMAHRVQEEILKELHQQSREYLDEDNDKNKKSFVDQGTVTETVMDKSEDIKQETQQMVNIINGHPKNGEDVLQIEIEELPAKDMAQEVEYMKENDSNENAVGSENEQVKNSHVNMETTEDDDDCRPQRIRRCSSLKTGKTPPGTPGRKKIVRFADVLGLDLADVKTFLDEIPNIPKSAYEDLEISESEPVLQLGPKSDKLLMPLFQQPGGLPNFLDVVREKLVSLENAAVTDTINQTITGCVRVRNLDFHKSVHIRYSLDGWHSFADLQANYVENSCDGFSDKFTFVLFGNSLHIGQRLEFAVRFQCKGQQYWDNNYGVNYCFQCLPSTAPVINPISTILPSHHNNNMVALLSPTVGETWCTSFY